MHSSHATQETTRTFGQGLLLLLCLGLWPLAGLSQDSRSLRIENLLFDPVALSTPTTPPQSAGSPRDLPAPQTPSGPPGAEALTLNSLPDTAALPVRDLPLEGNPRANAEEQVDDVVLRHQQVIEELELENGVYAAGLVQALMDLGSRYQQLGEHEQAIAVYERASHINRVNYGLFNLEQVPLISRLIQSQLAAGNLEAVDQQQEYLFYIQQKAHGSQSPELLPALSTLADWHIFAFMAGLSTDSITSPGGKGGVNVAPGASLGPESFTALRLVSAQNLYQAVINILLNTQGVLDPRLQETERKLALTNYFFASRYYFPTYTTRGSSAFSNQDGSTSHPALFSGSMGYEAGKEALERRLTYLREAPQTQEKKKEISAALLELADWQLLFRKRKAALENYQQAYQAYPQQDELGRVATFHPSVPTALPGFVAVPHSREAQGVPSSLSLNYQGYLDAAFTINSYGFPAQLQILGKSPAVPEAVVERLNQIIRRSQFRPRLEQGIPVEEDSVVIRYYYTFLDRYPLR